MSGYLAMARSVQSDLQSGDESPSVQHLVCDISDKSDQSRVIDSRVIDADTLKDHLALLYRDIQAGCRMGLHQHLDRVPAEIVRSIIGAAGPETDPDTFHALCERAGEAALLVSAIDEYRERLRLLVEMGEDVMRYATALELCLCHPVEGGVR